MGTSHMDVFYHLKCPGDLIFCTNICKILSPPQPSTTQTFLADLPNLLGVRLSGMLLNDMKSKAGRIDFLPACMILCFKVCYCLYPSSAATSLMTLSGLLSSVSITYEGDLRSSVVMVNVLDSALTTSTRPAL